MKTKVYNLFTIYTAALLLTIIIGFLLLLLMYLVNFAFSINDMQRGIIIGFMIASFWFISGNTIRDFKKAGKL